MSSLLRPLETQVLNSGEPRHYSSWRFPAPPKIDRSCLVASPEAHFSRQKVFAPRLRPRNLTQLLRVLRVR